MAQCEEQVFSGVASEHVAMFLAKGQQFGLPGLAGAGHSGQTSYSGFSLRWDYNPEAKTLAVQCTDSPMLVPCSLINGKIKDAVASVLGRAAPGPSAPEQG